MVMLIALLHSACGESQNATCLIPNPNEILAASGEQKLITISGENVLIFLDSFSFYQYWL